MTELEALNWFNAQEDIILVKEGLEYRLHHPRMIVAGGSFLECVIKMKKFLNV